MFIVEDYFGLALHQRLASDILKDYSDSFKYFPNLSNKIKDFLPEWCTKNDFGDENFLGFEILLDKLLEIKAL